MRQVATGGQQDSSKRHWGRCPICDGEELDFLFVSEGTPLVECADCGLILRNAALTDEQPRSLRVPSNDPPPRRLNPPPSPEVKRQAGERLLDQIETYARVRGQNVRGTSLLQIGNDGEMLLVAARARGYQVAETPEPAMGVGKIGAPSVREETQLQTVSEVEKRNTGFDVCVVTDGIGTSDDPTVFMEWVHARLRPEGILLVTAPNLESWPARIMGSQWEEFQTERLFYFNRETSRNLLFRSGFSNIVETIGGPPLSFRALLQWCAHKHNPRFLWAIRLATLILPGILRRKLRAHGRSEIVLLAQRSVGLPPSRRRHKLSIVLPVFNEAKTFPQVMDALLAKTFEHMDVEVIVIESNSTDGSRDAVLAYQDRPGVIVILEDRPQGKGHAVRNGLAHATGDFIVIQDADLEYDLNDYDHLLLPLRRYRKAFILGSRHSGASWKIRHFEDDTATSSLMNIGHVFFATVFNALYGQRLKDPFTMYKVFRRECLHNIALECNRFDFDCELVAKLVRRGHHPIEIPINYTSRSFAEGKKISFFRDPPTYLRAFLKYRFVDLDKEKARERAAASRA